MEDDPNKVTSSIDQPDEMNNFMPPVKTKHVLRTLLIILILITGIGVAAYIVILHPAKSTPSTSKTATTAAAGSKAVVSPKTTHFDSTTYNLGFDYPADWTVKDPGDSNLTATSPALQLKSSAGQTVNGQVVMTIEYKQSTVPQFATGTAVAAIASKKIAYTKPTQNQRAQTYLTFVNYKGSTTSIDGIYITGDNGYQPAQSVPQADIIQDDPLISISFYSCSDPACQAATSKFTAIAIPVSTWSDTSFSKPLVSLLESLTIN